MAEAQSAAFPPKLQGLFEPHRYKVLDSGRGCAKSWSIARALLLIGANPALLGRTHSSMAVCCARETMRSIKESVHKLLQDQIEILGLQDYYEVQDKVIIGRHNRTSFVFTGLRHGITDIKSMEGVDILWVEEAANVSAASWDIVIPTIRKEKSEIWISLNGELDTDETWKRFIVNPPSDTWHVHLTQEDNPWFPDVLRKESQEMKERDPKKWAHIYGGETMSSLEGAVYADEMAAVDQECRIRKVVYDMTKPVETFWDLGFDDRTSIWFVQRVAGEYRFIDHLTGSGKVLEFYVREMRRRNWLYGTCYLPWDALKTYKKLGSGKTAVEILRGAEFDVDLVKSIPVIDGINAARNMFPRCVFDAGRCATGIQSLRRYKWGDKVNEWTRKKEPLHDENSHDADAFRQAGIILEPVELKLPETKQESGFVPTPYYGGGGYSPFG